MDPFLFEFLEKRRMLDAQIEIGGIVGPGGDDVPTEQVTYLDVAANSEYIAKDTSVFDGELASFKGDLPADQYHVTIDWGDGNQEMGAIVAKEDGSYSIVGSHDFADKGMHGVSIDLTGDDGSYGFSYTNVISDASRLNLFGDPSVWAEPSTESQQQYLGTFLDVQPGNASSYQITIDWGDGSTSAGTASEGYGGAWDIYGDHAYAAEGTYNISVQITAGEDNVAATGTADVHAFEPIPVDDFPMADGGTGGVMYDMVDVRTLRGASIPETAPAATAGVETAAVETAVNLVDKAPASTATPQPIKTTLTSAPTKSPFSANSLSQQDSIFKDNTEIL